MRQVISVPSLPAHVHRIAARMRTADREEVAAHGLRPGAAIRASMLGSEFCRTCFVDGEPLAIFGLKMQDGCGVVWALTTTAVNRFPLLFWQASKHIVAELRARYRTLVQCIHASHDQALRWALRLGFTVDPVAHRCGPLGAPFHLVFLRHEG